MAQHQSSEKFSAGLDQAKALDGDNSGLDQARKETYSSKGDSVVAVARDKQVQFLDTSDMPWFQKSSANQVENQKARLERYASSHPEKGEELRANLRDFEERMKGRPDGDRQMAEVLQSVNSLLEASDKAALRPAASREAVAAQILKHSAHPGELNQGPFNSCAFATMETEAYSRQPGKAAQLVASTALTGKFEAHDGTRGKLDSATLNNWVHELPKGMEQLKDRLPPRDHASQIFQAVAFNVKLDNGESKLQFSLRPGDTYSPNGETVTSPDSAGENQIYKYLPNVYDYPSVYERLMGQKANGVVTIEDAANGDELQAQLQKLKADGKMPVAILVNSLSTPVMDAVGQDGAISAAASGVGMHVMTVSDINDDGTITYRNHLNARNEVSVSSDDMASYLTYPKLPDKVLNELVDKVHQTVPNSQLNSVGVALMLRQIHPEQRAEFVDRFEEKTGARLDRMLNDKENDRLGLSPWYKFW